ncbi:hypothetical protein MBLNU459_g2238t2 [Dothideomycetes sp. NU459]
MTLTTESTQHIPAWKKLGLKLKNAPDTPTETDSFSKVQNGAQDFTSSTTNSRNEQLVLKNGKKSKRARDEGALFIESKKPRLSSADQATPNVSNPAIPKHVGGSLVGTPARAQLGDADSNLRRSPSKGTDRRKSVTFSTDTKTEDGDSAHTLFKAWSAEQNPGGPANEHDMSAEEIEFYSALETRAAETAAEQAEQVSLKTETEVASPARKESKSKDVKSKEPKSKESKSKESKSKEAKQKEKKDKSSPAVPSPEKKTKVRTPKSNEKPTPAYVEYLTQYHRDKANWKFNKSKQTDLLKNIWNIYRVAPEHNDALSEYISGLQGAAARSRLRASAKKIVSDSVSFLRAEESADTSDMESAAARQAAYDAALAREVAPSEASVDSKQASEKVQTLRQKKAEDERAARLLVILMGDGDLDAEAKTAAAAAAAAAAAKAKENESARSRKKKRKSRTDVSDSDSDSDSSDSEEDSKPVASKTKKLSGNGKKVSSHDSSSEESDSDSSDETSSDSESDSDSDSDGTSSSDSSSAGSSSEDESGSETE